jgi:hypothetical protein
MSLSPCERPWNGDEDVPTPFQAEGVSWRARSGESGMRRLTGLPCVRR